jgi:hypothetical protein
MTAQKHLKERVRARMQKTGESYASARRQVLRLTAPPATDPATRWHFPGNVPATTALRVLLAHAGVRDPHTGQPFTEAMLFGLAGGIGIGACSFYYEKEKFSNFHLAGRHLFHDHVAYLRGVLGRLGIKSIIRETSGAKAAQQNLRDALQEGPCIAWVDGYRVITVYALRDDHALVGDLTDEPQPMALGDLAATRGRIKGQKHRLLSIPASDSPANLEPLIRAGLGECQRGLMQKQKRMPGYFTLEALQVWGERLHASKDKQAWERIFPPGPNLWRGLRAVYDCIEHQGTGGGLCRPLFADFLSEASQALGDEQLRELSKRYAELGRRWTALGEAALPDSVPELRQAKQSLAQKAEHSACGAAGEIRTCAAYLDKQAAQPFPLSPEQSAALRADLQARVFALHAAEATAQASLA